MLYDNDLKRQICELICLNGNSTIKTAEQYGIPLKTIEKWITAFHKNQHCFDSSNVPQVINLFNKKSTNNFYDDMSNDEFKKQLLKKDIEITRLKKGYVVKEGGLEKKVFITFSKKNTK